MLALPIATIRAPSALSISLVLAVFGFGQGLVMAPLSSVVLSTVKPLSAGYGFGHVRYYCTDCERRRCGSNRRGIFCG